MVAEAENRDFVDVSSRADRQGVFFSVSLYPNWDFLPVQCESFDKNIGKRQIDKRPFPVINKDVQRSREPDYVSFCSPSYCKSCDGGVAFIFKSLFRPVGRVGQEF